jgi:hypothetical protein
VRSPHLTSAAPQARAAPRRGAPARAAAAPEGDARAAAGAAVPDALPVAGEFSCFLELPVEAENSQPTNQSLTDNSPK